MPKKPTVSAAFVYVSGGGFVFIISIVLSALSLDLLSYLYYLLHIKLLIEVKDGNIVIPWWVGVKE